MINRLRQFWSDLQSSLWFVPTLMVLAALGAAVFWIEVDRKIDHDWLVAYPRLFGAGADGTRGMLTAIASSMITVAGLTFSLTIVAMAQASSQYSSRVLRNFMRDRRNQFVLGYFLGVFAYCLIVLRSIRGGDEGRFIPSLAAVCGLALAIASIGVLIFFIHHIATSIQASVIVKTAAEETIEAVRRLFPKELGREAAGEEKEEMSEKIERARWHPVAAGQNGYIQNVDAEGLIRFAEKRGCVLRMERGIGEFVVRGAPLVSIAAEAGEGLDEDECGELRSLYSVGAQRTIDQDAAYGIRQIVDAALKALSPGVNDTTTALIAIDYLTAILSELGGRNVEDIYRTRDGAGKIIARAATYGSLVADACDQIRDAAGDNAKVYERLLDLIAMASSPAAARRGRLSALEKQIELLADEAERSLTSDYNRQRLREKIIETKGFLRTRGSENAERNLDSTVLDADRARG